MIFLRDLTPEISVRWIELLGITVPQKRVELDEQRMVQWCKPELATDAPNQKAH